MGKNFVTSLRNRQLPFVLTLVFSLSVSLNILAQDVIPGLIPQFYGIEAATDLPIPAEEAHRLALEGKQDISLLNPDASSNIWDPQTNQITSHQLVKNGAQVSYISELPSRLGSFRFTVQDTAGKEFNIYLSKKAHSFLLRKNVLEKIGFRIPALQWLPSIKIDFPNTIERDLFIESGKDKLFGAFDRWIASRDGLSIELRDVMVFSKDSEIYNLALGLMPPEIPMGRRVLRSPYVPIALVDTPESINLMPWQSGRIVLNQIKLFHTQDLQNTFRTSWEDARWVGRRLASLDRRDWEEIVEKAYYPTEARLLLVEKIVARRNHLMELLQLSDQFKPLAFNPDISFGEGLKDGEIKQEFFPGYVTRFSFGDPESPFSASEIGYFVLSRLQSEAFSAALAQFNKLISLNDEKMYQDKVKDIIAREGILFPTQAVIVPSINGNLVISRDIVTGSYLGTNNRVQLVDTMGFSLDAGIMVGVEGLPIPINIAGKAGLALQRNYSHIKPVESLKKSIKEPYKNLIVPMLVQKIADKISDLKSTKPEDQQKELQAILAQIKSAMAVGESFIITDSIVPYLNTQLNLNVSQIYVADPNLLKVQAQLATQRVMLSRFHFTRVSEDEFQLYQDIGKNLGLSLSLKLKSYIPILSVTGRWSTVKAQTIYHSLDLSSRNADISLLKALRQSLLSTSHTPLVEINKPHVIDHKMKENSQTLEFLFFKATKIKSLDELSVKHAEGGSPRDVLRQYNATVHGVDFEGFTIDALNNLIGILTKTNDLQLSDSKVLNPGYTVFGRANSRIFTSEKEDDRVWTKYERVFNGWKVGPSRLKKLIADLNKEYGGELIRSLSYKDTDTILLYKIAIQVLISQEGVNQLLALSDPQLRNLIRDHGYQSIDQRVVDNLVMFWRQDIEKIEEYKIKDPGKQLRRLHDWLLSLSQYITVKGLSLILGEANVVAQARVDGFRSGDEAGDSPIISDMYGALPTPLHAAPTQQIMSAINVSEGELLINWMAGRAL